MESTELETGTTLGNKTPAAGMVDPSRNVDSAGVSRSRVWQDYTGLRSGYKLCSMNGSGMEEKGHLKDLFDAHCFMCIGVHIGLACMCIYAPCVCSACRVPKRATASWELELQKVLGHYVGAGN